MNYQETIEYLYSRLPVFQNIGARAYKPGLTTTLELCKILDNPQDKYKTIHVGGTNGKGSTSHMLAAILQEAGYKVGLYTSPHLKSFTERIRINGKEINQDYIVDFIAGNLSNIDRLSPSFFEVTVAMAFAYFAHEQVDVAVIEVGMGGRLDSTNVILPELSVITNVSFDHTQFLGDTLEKIAVEKAGIIKQNTPVVVSEYQEETAEVFKAVAEGKQAPVFFASERIRVENVGMQNGLSVVNAGPADHSEVSYPNLEIDLVGSYQIKNVAGVLQAVELLKVSGLQIESSAVYSALRRVTTLTGLKGRWQKLGDSPAIYCDTAHNVAGLTQTLKQFAGLTAKKHRYVIGFVGDKDISAMLAMMHSEAIFYFTEPTNSRALKAEKLQELASGFGLTGNYYFNVNDALNAAIADSDPEDCIYVGGSTFVVADLDNL
ncbi:bifunctional folylpolyglutamate synthase/dihydrofolate synthase [Dyadobacter luteus]|uniref:Dihydrofolate synthase/folylpolyglutamate synthase n=1 Tax=Dyadobacter luteus TaxID=2259619 RepID=A0A3D8YGT0_9BACT|nr:folylpolyglutamate synthase/dihydrofolate synthase family protein [Dyadobacter luteus]REA64059.1 bifunctional folylpolyglutamate synthase/dihydrofolate synthase [Dyadobacter luteus]